MKIGLTLGKYAPLHQGHQLVIETALSEMDRVVVMIYNAPETTACPLAVRSRWLRSLYPTVDVVEAWDGPTETGASPEITRKHDEYILRMMRGRAITHVYSSEFYGEHVAMALCAMDRRVDPERRKVPISATEIRNDLFAKRGFVHPIVYRDLITKAVFLGAPSTGKTTIAKECASLFSTVCMPEYGREYWDKNQVDRRLTAEQLVEIAVGHREREERLFPEANNYIFIDTDATTTYQFSLYYHGAVHPDLGRMAEETRSRYDLFFLCEDDIPYEDTEDRSGEVNRALFQKQIRADLEERKIPFISLCGPLEGRVNRVKNVLAKFEKFRPFALPYTKG